MGNKKVFVVIRDTNVSSNKLSSYDVAVPRVFGMKIDIAAAIGCSVSAIMKKSFPCLVNGCYVYECYYTPVCRNAKGNSSNLIK